MLVEVKGVMVDPEYVTEEGNELCVVCKTDTGISVDTHILERYNYIEGVGQCCERCASK